MYFYIYAYDALHGVKTLHSLGRRDKALDKLAGWKDAAAIPTDLMALGLKLEDVQEWKKKIASFQDYAC